MIFPSYFSYLGSCYLHVSSHWYNSSRHWKWPGVFWFKIKSTELHTTNISPLLKIIFEALFHSYVFVFAKQSIVFHNLIIINYRTWCIALQVIVLQKIVLSYHSYMFSRVTDTSAVSPRPLTGEERLLKDLFLGYNPSARPVIDPIQTAPVSIYFALLSIKDLVSGGNVAVIKHTQHVYRIIGGWSRSWVMRKDVTDVKSSLTWATRNKHERR